MDLISKYFDIVTLPYHIALLLILFFSGITVTCKIKYDNYGRCRN